MEELGRACALAGQPEVALLEAGMDFRAPAYRREVFKRFYAFHLKYRAHPGCVYYLMPYLAARYGWTAEQRLWFAYLNGNTQNPVTSYRIMRAFPTYEDLRYEALEAWFGANYPRLEFDTDRRYHKKEFLANVRHFTGVVGRRPLTEFFATLARPDAGEEQNFQTLWGAGPTFRSFGRLSRFSYLEYLRIMGLPVRCDNLFLEDLDGSRSHRNGLCRVLGRDDLDWHASNPDFPGYSEPMIAWLKAEAATLLAECAERLGQSDVAPDVNYFTLESALCTYKSWHRRNRRYPNVYNDMLFNRITNAERAWGERFDDFWDARRVTLPAHLRLEDNPTDCGLKPRKQNHYLDTGQVIMMTHEWPCFANSFSAA